MFHDHETAGHPGELETYNAIRQHLGWPGLRTFIKNYVQGCGICQQFKIDRHPSKLRFYPTEGAMSTRPFAYCSMDLITDLPISARYDSILVVVNQGLTKGVILLPCSKTITAEGVAKLLLENLYKRFGLQNDIRSRTTIRVKRFRRIVETFRYPLSIVHRLLSTNGWNNGTGKSGNRSIPIYLLYITSRRMVDIPAYHGIHTQQPTTRRSTKNSIRVDVWRNANCCTTILQTYKVPGC
jgi:hypothetical protein